MTAPNYIRYIHPTHREAIKERYVERYSIQELLIMYRGVLHDNEKIAIRQLKALTNGLERVEKI